MKINTLSFVRYMMCVGALFTAIGCGPTTKTACEKEGGYWHCELIEGVEDCECDIYTELPDTIETTSQ